MDVGIVVHMRDVETLDDAGDITAPAPVEPGDLVATADDLYRVKVVLVPAGRRPVEPVLARRVALPLAVV
jgi:hypothetical protein